MSPLTSNFIGGNDADTSFDVSSDIILPNDNEDILMKGFKGDRTSSGSRGIPSNVSFYPDGTSSPQQKRFVLFLYSNLPFLMSQNALLALYLTRPTLTQSFYQKIRY